RVQPKPGLDVSFKRNPTLHEHKACGDGGYTKLTSQSPEAKLPSLSVGTEHELAAQVEAGGLQVYADGLPVWSGTLPALARQLVGPAGLRSDNIRFELRVLGESTRR
ncbi:MAG: hypothetical protein ABW321_08780, partial [Polyangiales bacterium]